MTIIRKKIALITGISGQDGFYLAKQLLENGYHVIGTSHSMEGFYKISSDYPEVYVKKLNINDVNSIEHTLSEFKPQEIYNLAARSSSKQLFDDPINTAMINGLATVCMLEAIRNVVPNARFCQASSSEIFAGAEQSPQNEYTPYAPLNAYGAAKAFATNIVSAYRDKYDIYATTAILFNHESPLRGKEYITRKITNAAAKIALKKESSLIVGNLDSRRDWGFAGDYTKAMWLTLQHTTPEDYIVATGYTHSVKELCEIAFSHVGLEYREFIKVDSSLVHRNEKVELRGDPSKIMNTLGWRPTISFENLITMMVDADLQEQKLA